MDPLSDLLSLLRPRHFGFRNIDAGPSWRLAYPSLGGLFVFVIRHGCCAIKVGGQDETRLKAGDVALVSGNLAFTIGSTAVGAPRPAMPFLETIEPGGTGTLDGGGDCLGTGGYFGFEPTILAAVARSLPKPIVFGSREVCGPLIVMIDRIVGELRDPRPGGVLYAEHLAQCLLIEAFRSVAATGDQGDPGVFTGLRDRGIRSALSAMHATPGESWTLKCLAARAGLSRTIFAVRFREKVGETPFGYLSQLRVAKACDRLMREPVTLAQLADDLGYSSESAFGVAFKRVTGESPRRFMKTLQQNR